MDPDREGSELTGDDADTGDVRSSIGALRDVVGELASSVGGLAANLEQTREQLAATQGMVRSQARLNRGQRLVTSIMLALFVLALAGGAYFVIRTNDIVGKVRETQLSNQQTQRQIEDCLIPTGKCYEESQRRTAAVVGAITDANHNGVPDVNEILGALGKR